MQVFYSKHVDSLECHRRAKKQIPPLAHAGKWMTANSQADEVKGVVARPDEPIDGGETTGEWSPARE